MDERYLWDKSGDPDPEVQRLENLLAPLAYRAEKQIRPVRRWAALSIIAAALILTSSAVWMATRTRGPSWQVVTLSGQHQKARISRGGTIETDAESRLRLELSTFGHVEVEPNTQLKLLVTQKEEQRMALARGKIHAEIWAPPGQFYVNTPSAVAVDLGCSYSLEVDPRTGNSLVRVDFGWVALDDHDRESFIPAEAACVTRPGKGPGIPYYEDAPAGLRQAVDRFDSTADPRTISVIAADARPRDALTLWHLLRRAPVEDRGAVYDRLGQLIRIPPSVSRDRVIAGDSKSIDALWDSLGLGETSWWRMWKR